MRSIINGKKFDTTTAAIECIRSAVRTCENGADGETLYFNPCSKILTIGQTCPDGAKKLFYIPTRDIEYYEDYLSEFEYDDCDSTIARWEKFIADEIAYIENGIDFDERRIIMGVGSESASERLGRKSEKTRLLEIITEMGLMAELEENIREGEDDGELSIYQKWLDENNRRDTASAVRDCIYETCLPGYGEDGASAEWFFSCYSLNDIPRYTPHYLPEISLRNDLWDEAWEARCNYHVLLNQRENKTRKTVIGAFDKN